MHYMKRIPFFVQKKVYVVYLERATGRTLGVDPPRIKLS